MALSPSALPRRAKPDLCFMSDTFFTPSQTPSWAAVNRRKSLLVEDIHSVWNTRWPYQKTESKWCLGTRALPYIKVYEELVRLYNPAYTTTNWEPRRSAWQERLLRASGVCCASLRGSWFWELVRKFLAVHHRSELSPRPAWLMPSENLLSAAFSWNRTMPPNLHQPKSSKIETPEVRKRIDHVISK